MQPQTITKESATARLATIRQALRDESISYQELAELAALAPFIDPSDKELLEAAGVKEGALMDYLRACEYSDYLLKTGQAFCYLPNGELITREYCNQIIDEYNTIKN